MENAYYDLFKVQKQTPVEDGILPKELQFFEDLRSQYEDIFCINIISLHKNAIDYNYLCLESVDLWLNDRIATEGQSNLQRIITLQVLKGRRLLRSAQLLLIKGFLPESEILLRSLFETQLITNFLVEDKDGGRLNKYLEFQDKNRWDTRYLCDELCGTGTYEFYKRLCQYTHSSSIGLSGLFYKDKEQPSAIHDYAAASTLLIFFGNLAVSLCELAIRLFPYDLKWEEKHQEIYNTDIFKKNYEVFLELYKQGDERFIKIFEHHGKASHDKNQAVG